MSRVAELKIWDQQDLRSWRIDVVQKWKKECKKDGVGAEEFLEWFLDRPDRNMSGKMKECLQLRQ